LARRIVKGAADFLLLNLRLQRFQRRFRRAQLRFRALCS
jgi:hypothetical protein